MLIATYRTELVGKGTNDILQSLETLLRMTNEAPVKIVSRFNRVDERL